MSEVTTSESTPRAALAAADEKKVAAIATKYDGEAWGAWAERYARKVLKVKNGLRSTPAPVPPEMPKEVAKEIREGFLGKDKVKETATPKPAAKKTTAKKTTKKPAAKKDQAPAKTDEQIAADAATEIGLSDLLP